MTKNPKTHKATKVAPSAVTPLVAQKQASGSTISDAPVPGLGLLSDVPTLPVPVWPEGFPKVEDLSLAAIGFDSVNISSPDGLDPEKWRWIRPEYNEKASELGDEIENLEGEWLDLESKLGDEIVVTLVSGSGAEVEVDDGDLGEAKTAVEGLPDSEHKAEALRLLGEIGEKWEKLQGLQEKIREMEEGPSMPDYYLNHAWPIPDHMSGQEIANSLAEYDEAGGTTISEVVENEDTGDLFLLTVGGGMDLTDRIIEGYVAAGIAPPLELVTSFTSNRSPGDVDTSRLDDAQTARLVLVSEACLRTLDAVSHRVDRSTQKIVEILQKIGWPGRTADEVAAQLADEELGRRIGRAQEKNRPAVERFGDLSGALDSIEAAARRVALDAAREILAFAKSKNHDVTGIQAIFDRWGEGTGGWTLLWSAPSLSTREIELDDHASTRSLLGSDLPEEMKIMLEKSAWRIAEAMAGAVGQPGVTDNSNGRRTHIEMMG